MSQRERERAYNMLERVNGLMKEDDDEEDLVMSAWCFRRWITPDTLKANHTKHPPRH